MGSPLQGFIQKMFFIVLLLLFAYVAAVPHQAAAPGSRSRVLAIPLPGAASHARIMSDLASGLTFRGHDVWLLVEKGEASRYSSFAVDTKADPKLIVYDTGVSETDWREGELGGAVATLSPGSKPAVGSASEVLDVFPFWGKAVPSLMPPAFSPFSHSFVSPLALTHLTGARKLRFSNSVTSVMTGFRVWAKQSEFLLKNETLALVKVRRAG